MVQVQSTLVPAGGPQPADVRDIYTAKAEDFKKQTHRVYRSAEHPSKVTVRVMP